MRQIQRQLLVLGASLAALGVSASSPSSRQEMTDSLVADHHIMVIGGEDRETLKRDSIRSMIENFYYDQFKNYQDPAAPYFLFMSHDANMAMGVGGVVRMRAYYDPGNSMPGAAFTPYNVPMGDTPLNRNHFGTTPSGTSLFCVCWVETLRWARISCTFRQNSMDMKGVTSSSVKLMQL